MPTLSARPFGLLVVEGEPVLRAFLTTLLGSLGVAAFPAADGRAAASLLLRHQGEIDAVLIDPHLPGAAGSSAHDLLHGIEPGLPCGLIGGPDAEGPPTLPRGFRCALGWPLSVAGLLDCVESLRGEACVATA